MDLSKELALAWRGSQSGLRATSPQQTSSQEYDNRRPLSALLLSHLLLLLLEQLL